MTLLSKVTVLELQVQPFTQLAFSVKTAPMRVGSSKKLDHAVTSNTGTPSSLLRLRKSVASVLVNAELLLLPALKRVWMSAAVAPELSRKGVAQSRTS